MKNLRSSLNKGKTFSLFALTLVGALTIGSHQSKADALGEVGNDPPMAVELYPPTIPMGPRRPPTAAECEEEFDKCLEDAAYSIGAYYGKVILCRTARRLCKDKAVG